MFRQQYRDTCKNLSHRPEKLTHSSFQPLQLSNIVDNARLINLEQSPEESQGMSLSCYAPINDLAQRSSKMRPELSSAVYFLPTLQEKVSETYQLSISDCFTEIA